MVVPSTFCDKRLAVHVKLKKRFYAKTVQSYLISFVEVIAFLDFYIIFFPNFFK